MELDIKCPECGTRMFVASSKYGNGMLQYWLQCPNKHDDYDKPELRPMTIDELQKELEDVGEYVGWIELKGDNLSPVQIVNNNGISVRSCEDNYYSKMNEDGYGYSWRVWRVNVCEEDREKVAWDE